MAVEEVRRERLEWDVEQFREMAMKRRAARTDANQREIVRALRIVGATVADTSALGGGFPDIVVGWRADNFLLEIKDGTKPPSARKLTAAEEGFIGRWRGTVYVVKSADEALRAIGVIR